MEIRLGNLICAHQCLCFHWDCHWVSQPHLTSGSPLRPREICARSIFDRSGTWMAHIHYYCHLFCLGWRKYMGGLWVCHRAGTQPALIFSSTRGMILQNVVLIQYQVYKASIIDSNTWFFFFYIKSHLSNWIKSTTTEISVFVHSWKKKAFFFSIRKKHLCGLTITGTNKMIII